MRGGSRLRTASILLIALCASAVVVEAARWLRAPAPVPDHAAPFVATRPMLFAGEGGLSQGVRPRRDGLRAVDLILVAEEPGLPGDVEVRLLAWPSGGEVRRARLPAADLPHGDAWRFRPGQPEERWQSFGFEPVPDSAGRDYVFTLRYPAGRDVPGERLAVLVHLPARYPDGDMLLNGAPLSGNLLFRIAGTGTRVDAVRVASDNLARQQPYSSAGLSLPGAVAALGLVLAAGLLAALGLAGRRVETAPAEQAKVESGA